MPKIVRKNIFFCMLSVFFMNCSYKYFSRFERRTLQEVLHVEDLNTTTIFLAIFYIGFLSQIVMMPFNQLRVRLKTLLSVRQRKNADMFQDHQQELSHIVHSHGLIIASLLVGAL